jgi:hypothetical protein
MTVEGVELGRRYAAFGAVAQPAGDPGALAATGGGLRDPTAEVPGLRVQGVETGTLEKLPHACDLGRPASRRSGITAARAGLEGGDLGEHSTGRLDRPVGPDELRQVRPHNGLVRQHLLICLPATRLGRAAGVVRAGPAPLHKSPS